MKQKIGTYVTSDMFVATRSIRILNTAFTSTVLSLHGWNIDTKSIILVPISHWDMTHNRPVVTIAIQLGRIALYFSTSQGSWRTVDVLFLPSIVQKSRKVIVHNVATKPSPKESRLLEFQFCGHSSRV